MKKLSIIFLFIFLRSLFLHADEGMWIPIFLKKNEAQMKSMGMKLSVEDIYSVNNNSLKDAIILFGRGCTGELISDEGLMLTNHHCGYSQIQAHSSLENDYLKHGFWASNRKEELVNQGLTVSFLVRMDDVTEEVLKGVENNITEAVRQGIIEKNIAKITKEATKGTHYQASIKGLYNGNQYFIYVTEVFKDVRLVGAPPSSIGKFGGDTDNWMWPRHTGDFALYRIYADKDNKPADYSADNVPYKPKKFFPISLKGVEKGDFTFVYGFPGSTNQFATSYEVELIKELENPIAIEMRDKRLSIIDAYMKTDDLIRIQYSAKYANIANGWKKWIGENRGLQKLNTIENKRRFEAGFQKWADSEAELKEKFGGLLDMYKKIYTEQYQTRRSYKYFVEAALGSEIVTFAWRYNNLLKLSKDKNASAEEIKKNIEQLKASAKGSFVNYNVNTDKELFLKTMKAYYDSFENKNLPKELAVVKTKYKGNFENYTNFLFEKSIFTSSEKVLSLLDNYQVKNYKQIENDPLFKLSFNLFNNYFENIYPGLIKYETQLDSLNRIYLQGLFAYQKEKTFYPDANLTLRVTYGKVDDYYPRDGVRYEYFTTLEGIFEKEKLEYDDYEVHPRLKELFEKKDYGRYGQRGTVNVCFIASNHTTGGNSGSPVINGEGHLIGINFDRNWEGTMSDLNYDPNQCRNISLDMRYVLFIIDKFAGAGHLIEEMTVIE